MAAEVVGWQEEESSQLHPCSILSGRACTAFSSRCTSHCGLSDGESPPVLRRRGSSGMCAGHADKGVGNHPYPSQRWAARTVAKSRPAAVTPSQIPLAPPPPVRGDRGSPCAHAPPSGRGPSTGVHHGHPRKKHPKYIPLSDRPESPSPSRSRHTHRHTTSAVRHTHFTQYRVKRLPKCAEAETGFFCCRVACSPIASAAVLLTAGNSPLEGVLPRANERRADLGSEQPRVGNHVAHCGGDIDSPVHLPAGWHLAFSRTEDLLNAFPIVTHAWPQCPPARGP